MGIFPAAVHTIARRAAPTLYSRLALAKSGKGRRSYADFISASPDRARAGSLVRRIQAAHFAIRPPHLHEELMKVINFVASPEARKLQGDIVEAGCFQGGSATKLSIIAAAEGRKLVLFDSFEGLPHDEPDQMNIYGSVAQFKAGEWAGSLEQVQENISRHGEIGVCEFRRGWFDQTMPSFDRPIIAAYVDVDLVSSTRTCLIHLYRQLVPGGRLFSQDGHLALVIELLRDASFWRDEVGVEPPRMEGLGTDKLVTIFKD